MTAAIRLRNLSAGYGAHRAVHQLCGELAFGSLTAVVGPNGAGKTTLLNTIHGYLSPIEGQIEFDQPDIQVAYLPQQSEIDRTFPMSVYELVALGAWGRVGAFAPYPVVLREKVSASIAEVGLTGFEDRVLATLSAGQFQRALFARVLLSDAPLILLDEPFNAIDARTTRDLIEVVRRWHRERRTVVAVLHDLDQVRAHFPDCLLIARECIAWGKTAEVLVPCNLEKARQIAEGAEESFEYGSVRL